MMMMCVALAHQGAGPPMLGSTPKRFIANLKRFCVGLAADRSARVWGQHTQCGLSAAPRSRPATASHALRFQFERLGSFQDLAASPDGLPPDVPPRRTSAWHSPPHFRRPQPQLGSVPASAALRPPAELQQRLPAEACGAAAAGGAPAAAPRPLASHQAACPSSLPPALSSQGACTPESCSVAPQVSRRGRRTQTARGCMALSASTLPTLCSAIPLGIFLAE